MTAKEYLSQHKLIDQRINRKYEEIERLRSLATKTTSTLKDICVSSSHSNSKIEDIVIKLNVMEKDLIADIDILVELRQEITEKLNTIKNKKLQLILQYRYIDGLTFDEIAMYMGYSHKHICRLHGKALLQVEVK